VEGPVDANNVWQFALGLLLCDPSRMAKSATLVFYFSKNSDEFVVGRPLQKGRVDDRGESVPSQGQTIVDSVRTDGEDAVVMATNYPKL